MAAMERWRNGRRELLEKLTNVYDQIGLDLAAELESSNGVYIGREELQRLQEGSARVEGLEKEILALQRQGRNQEAIRNDGRLVQELAQDNAPIAEKQKSAKDYRKVAGGPNDGGTDINSTPVSSEPFSSARRIDGSASNVVTREAYQALVTKYNTLHKNWNDLNCARKLLDESLREEKVKTRRYYVFVDSQEKAMLKKDEKIKRQDEAIKSLELQLRELGARLNRPRTAESGATQRVHLGLDNEVLAAEVFPSGEQIAVEAIKHTPEVAYLMDEISVISKNSDAHHLYSESPRRACATIQQGVATVDTYEDTKLERIENYQSSSTEGDTDIISHHENGERSGGIKIESPPGCTSLQDTPVVVSSRSVKKRKRHNGAAGSSTGSQVKIEVITSSPIGLAAFHGLESNDSIDLDEIGEKVDTPKKRRRLLELSRQASKCVAYDIALVRTHESRSKDRRSTDIISGSKHVSKGTQICNVGLTRAGSALQPKSSNKQILPRTSDNGMAKKDRIPDYRALGNLIEDGHSTLPVENIATNRRARELSSLLGSLLENPSPTKNVLSPPRASPQLNQQSGRSSDSLKTSKLARGHLNVNKTSDALPLKSTCTSAVEPLKHHSGQALGVSREHLEPPSLRRAVQQPGDPIRPSKRQSWSREEAIQPDIDDSGHKAFRDRQLQELGLEHFKVNPNYNPGYTYAFTDVVRNQADRRCLQGCVKPECCGKKFRALAEIARDSKTLQTPSQQKDDQHLLDEFMGDNRHRLGSMTEEERDETLLQARTRQLANKYGKHRHAFERRQSPPGFWRADFPTTQEAMTDRERAAKVERDLVAQRYEDAMRPGGAYAFRDE